MESNRFFMPNRQIFRGGPEHGGNVEKNKTDQPTFNEASKTKESHEEIIDKARKNLVKLKQEPVFSEITPIEKEIHDRLAKCEVRKQTIDSYLNTIRQIESGKGGGPVFEADKKLVESLKGKILTICNDIEKDAIEIRDVLAEKDADKTFAQQYIDYAKNIRDSLK